MGFSKNMQRAVEALSRLPEIGPRVAERIVFYLIKKGPREMQELEEAINGLRQGRFCGNCFNIAEDGLCSICKDKSRVNGIICVVETPLDLLAIEKQDVFKGRYHVLGGSARIGQRDNTDKLKIEELKKRLGKEKVKEVILATNPTTLGDITARAVKEALGDGKDIKITRIGRGMPTGGDIEYADYESLAGSMNSRREF